MPCSNAAKTRNQLKFGGCPKLTNRSQPLVGRSSPYCGIWRTYCCLTSFFSDCRYVPQLRRYSPSEFWDGAQIAISGDFFASCIFSEPRAAGFTLQWRNWGFRRPGAEAMKCAPLLESPHVSLTPTVGFCSNIGLPLLLCQTANYPAILIFL